MSVTDSSARSTQRQAPGPDRLTSLLDRSLADPASGVVGRDAAIAESNALVDEAGRGDISSWQLRRAEELARQFPAIERLQVNVGRLTRILAGPEAAACCWRGMMMRFPESVWILAHYARSLRALHDPEAARRIVEAYIPPAETISRPKQALRAARALHALGDAARATELLDRIARAHPGHTDSVLQIARWQEDAGDFEAARERLAGLPAHPAVDAAKRRIERHIALFGPSATHASAAPSLLALGKLLDIALENRGEPRAPRRGRPIGGVGIIGSTLGGGGAERQLVTTALGLSRTSAARLAGPLTVYCRKLDTRRRNDFYLPALETAGIRVVDYRRIPAFGGKRDASVVGHLDAYVALLPPHMREGVRRLTDLLRHDAPDVVQIWQDGTIFAAGLAALLAGIPRIILSVRTMPPTARTDRLRLEQPALYRGLLRAPGVTLTANSRIAARGYEDWLGLPGGAVPVVLNGVAPLAAGGGEAARRLWADFDARTGAGFVFGGVMRLDENKRPLEWLAIAAALGDRVPDARFVLVGDGPLRAAAAMAAQRLGIADRTLFVGRSEDVGFWLERFDALALTSLHEGTPNALIEAQLSGVPVLATPAGGAAETVAPLPANLVLPDAAAPDRALAGRHLAKLSRRPVRETAEDSRALKEWAGRYSVPRMIERTLDLFGAPG